MMGPGLWTTNPETIELIVEGNTAIAKAFGGAVARVWHRLVDAMPQVLRTLPQGR
jgi:uncharacterized membrane protein YjfL (UPF0719 family)